MTKQDLLRLGFTEPPHRTIGDIVSYDLDNDRAVSISDIGTPNEYVAITQSNPDNPYEITDVVRLHNYDYDGYLTEERVLDFMKLKK